MLDVALGVVRIRHVAREVVELHRANRAHAVANGRGRELVAGGGGAGRRVARGRLERRQAGREREV